MDILEAHCNYYLEVCQNLDLMLIPRIDHDMPVRRPENTCCIPSAALLLLLVYLRLCELTLERGSLQARDFHASNSQFTLHFGTPSSSPELEKTMRCSSRGKVFLWHPQQPTQDLPEDSLP